jgi:hypothetical protein
MIEVAASHASSLCQAKAVIEQYYVRYESAL